MNRSRLSTLTAASTLALLAGAAHAADPTMPNGALPVVHVGRYTQEFTVPGYYGSTWRFVVEGADGGDASRRRNGNEVERYYGGPGATMTFNCVIGTGVGQLRPGGTIRYIIGDLGETHSTTTYADAFRVDGAGGGGGAGSGILYLPPGETDWNNAEILAAAAGGGGAYVISGGSSQEGHGGEAYTGACGGNPTFGCDGNEVRSACDGESASGDHAENGTYVPVGGMGTNDAFPDGGQWEFSLGSRTGAWGFGGGGLGGGEGQYVSAGGGGGYAGGGGYCAAFSHPHEYDCHGGGGGGGSYINPVYAMNELRISNNTGKYGAGDARPVIVSLDNDTWPGAVPLASGEVAAAAFDIATPSAFGFCGQGVTAPDVWFSYTNAGLCPEQLTLTLDELDFSGAALTPGTITIHGYTGADPTTGACRSVSAGGVYTDVVQPGETVALRVSSSDLAAAPLLRLATEAVPDTNTNIFTPAAVIDGVETFVDFCGGPVTLDYTDCDPTITDGYLGYYEFVNTNGCTVDATFQLTSGVLSEIRVFDVENGCAEPQIGQLTSTLAPGERMLLQIISQTGNPLAFQIDIAFDPTLPDCDNDGVPDSCDPDGPCELPANDDMANPFDLPLGQSPYDARRATHDGTSSCDAAASRGDVWYTHTAAADGQLIVSALSNAGLADTGRVGLTLFTGDGLTEIDCDYAGAQTDLYPIGAERNTVAVAPVAAGDTVLVRLVMPADATPADPIAQGSIWIDLDTSFTNDLCDRPVEIPLAGDGSVDLPFDLTYAQNDAYGDGCIGSGAQIRDAWYTFTAPSAGTATFYSRRNGGASPVLGVFEFYDACGGTVLGCSQAGAIGVDFDMTRGQTVWVRAMRVELFVNLTDPVLRTTFVGVPGCGDADLAEPFGQLDFSDVVAFLTGFGTCEPEADLAEPFGSCDFSDVIAFLSAFGAGCP